MSRHPNPPNDSWESDPIWQLLDQVPPAPPSPHFVIKTVAAAHQNPQASSPNWGQIVKIALASLSATGLAAALAIVFISAPDSPAPATVQAIDPALGSSQAEAIEDIAQAETLIAATDHLEDFSDTELVSMIGF